MEVKSEDQRDTTLYFDINAIEEFLSQLSLTSVKLGNHIMIMRNSFDVIISEEPYMALLFLFDIEHGLFLARIWNQTVASGKLWNIDQFMSACKSHFCGGRPCIGSPMSESQQSELHYIVLNIPLPRKFSKQCHKVLGDNDTEPGTASCKACMNFDKSKSSEVVRGVSKEDIIGESDFGVEEVISGIKREDDFEEVSACLSANESCFDMDEVNNVESTKNEEDFLDVSVHSSQDDIPPAHGVMPGGGFKRDSKIQQKTKQILNDSLKTKIRLGGEELEMRDKAILIFNNSIEKSHREREKLEAEEKGLTSVDDSLRKRKKWSCLWCGKVLFQTTAEHHKKRQHFWGVFRCHLCDLEFFFARDLMNHFNLEGHTLVKSVTCPACKDIILVEDIENHYKSCVLKNEKHVTCEFCSEQMPHNSSKIHKHMQRKHFLGDFKCPVCCIGADFAQDLVSHMEETGHSMQNWLIKCPMCKEQFPQDQLNEHVQSCFTSFYNNIKNTKRKLEVKKKKLEVKKENAVCPDCGKTYKSKYELNKHIKYEHPAPGESAPAPLPCHVCGKMFKCRNYLQQHIRNVHDGRSKMPHTCSVCKKIFPTRDRMLYHKAKDHTDATGPFLCAQCGYTGDSLRNLKRHYKVHEEAKFKCSFCEMTLKSRSSLAAHEREHTGERPFKCDVCRNGYKSKSALAFHRRCVHTILAPGQAPYVRGKRKT